MLSDKRKRELTKNADEATEAIRFFRTIENMENFDVEFLFLSYICSEKLVKHSKTLTCLTIWLALTASAMTGLALVQWLEYLNR